MKSDRSSKNYPHMQASKNLGPVPFQSDKFPLQSHGLETEDGPLDRSPKQRVSAVVRSQKERARVRLSQLSPRR